MRVAVVIIPMGCGFLEGVRNDDDEEEDIIVQ